MAEFSNYMENLIINHMLRAQAYTPVTVYVALFTAETGLEANNPTAEVTGNAYARQVVGLSNAVGDGVSSNAGDITFPVATPGAWGNVTHVALVDHISNVTWGSNVNVLMWSLLDNSKQIDANDQFKILATQLGVTVA
jgi:hypothetical protein